MSVNKGISSGKIFRSRGCLSWDWWERRQSRYMDYEAEDSWHISVPEWDVSPAVGGLETWRPATIIFL